MYNKSLSGQKVGEYFVHGRWNLNTDQANFWKYNARSCGDEQKKRKISSLKAHTKRFRFMRIFHYFELEDIFWIKKAQIWASAETHKFSISSRDCIRGNCSHLTSDPCLAQIPVPVDHHWESTFPDCVTSWYWPCQYRSICQRRRSLTCFQMFFLLRNPAITG